MIPRWAADTTTAEIQRIFKKFMPGLNVHVYRSCPYVPCANSVGALPLVLDKVQIRILLLRIGVQHQLLKSLSTAAA